MNIVLLSGGSGKRLWPLSNDTRSKQFLSLLKAPDGSSESMVQRVYRQIKESDNNAGIVIATGKTQTDSIRNHLGNKVDIVTEPSRRNTYPAIALATSYLKTVKGIADDEVVIVLPVDPYAEAEYFNTLSRMEAAVKAGAGDLVLMGIKPTYPSAKYGYIVPKADQSSEPFKVDYFKEKPTEADAEKLIAGGAVWNGGVFAFKAGWLLDIVKNNVGEIDYNYLDANYDKLTKDSFDYEVCEKTNNIAFVSYNGIWKDLGTWNTLTEQMENEILGDVIVGEGTSGTHIINELDVPVVALGVNDLVIAASPDGILVSDKQKSSYLKPYVDKLEAGPMYEQRLWGEKKILNITKVRESESAVTESMFMLKGHSLESHSHNLKKEVWVVTSGKAEIEINGEKRTVSSGDTIEIMPGTIHGINAITDFFFTKIAFRVEE